MVLVSFVVPNEFFARESAVLERMFVKLAPNRKVKLFKLKKETVRSRGQFTIEREREIERFSMAKSLQVFWNYRHVQHVFELPCS